MAFDIKAKLGIIFGVLVSLIYCGLGIFIFYSETILSNIQTNSKRILGAIIFIYGIFRMYRVLKNLRNKDNEENLDEPNL